jgi:hypothetical protein
MSDEPVAYLGGDQGAPEYGDAPPPPAEDEVDGYLGGTSSQAPADEEELPALPPQESAGNYSARDFLDSEAQEAPAEDPYADPYAQPGDAPEPGYGDYEGYDSAAVEQSDPAYFDSMAHGPSTDAAPSADEYATEDDPDQPKTISQQDAESIIRRITTKRILPPESGEKKPVAPPPPKLTEARGGLRIWPILFVVVVVGGMAVAFFGEQIADAVPALRPFMPWLPAKVEAVRPDQIGKVDPNEVAKKKLLEMVALSEAKAFSVAVKDLPPAAAVAKPGAGDMGSGVGPGKGGGPGPGGMGGGK